MICSAVVYYALYRAICTYSRSQTNILFDVLSSLKTKKFFDDALYKKNLKFIMPSANNAQIELSALVHRFGNVVESYTFFLV